MALQAMVFPGQFDNLQSDWDWDRETITKAKGYLHHLKSASFLVAFKIILEILTNLRDLTVKLQMQMQGDAFYAYSEVKVITRLKGMRSTSERDFSCIFAKATKLGKDLHGDEFKLCMPRVNRQQVHHSNIKTQSAEDYFRIAIYEILISSINCQVDFLTTQITLLAFIFCQVNAAATWEMHNP